MATLNSSITLKAKEDRAIYRALTILKNRMREPGCQISGSAAVRDYLKLLLAAEDREVFAVLYMDAQNRLIEAETPFYGTLTQTSVYPREILRQALYHNAGSVIFAHNHPSGKPEPSQADMMLTCALIDALTMVDIRVLDHFIVAGDRMLSFAESHILGKKLLVPDDLPGKRRVRARKAHSLGI